MDLYLGTKAVLARPMSRVDYNTYRGWVLPADENGDDAGMLVEYVDGGKANHPDHAGYISWSPLDVFGRAYRVSGNLTFGQALEALKQGKRIARSGWNGKGMWLCLSGPLEGRTINALSFWSDHCRAYAEENGGKATVLPCINMKTATGEILMGWLASQTDMLCEDWCILDDEASSND